MRVFLIFACLTLAGSTATAYAQKTTAPAPKNVTPDDSCTTDGEGRVECRRVFGRGGMFMDSVLMKRAAIGVQVSGTGSSRDTLGLFVSSVTPKGPAENAGIVEGDRLVSINGVDLRVPAADVDDGYASGLPSRRLQREVSKLSPGTRANLRVYSGGRIRDVQVTTGRASDLTRARTMIGFGGDWPDGATIYRDGWNMAPLENMRIREMGPEFEKLRMSIPKMRMSFPRMQMSEPEWRRMREMLPELRRMEFDDMPMLEPGRVYRLRSPERIRKLETERAKARAKTDSAKKARK